VSGTFTLYYDDQYGNRYPVQGARCAEYYNSRRRDESLTQLYPSLKSASRPKPPGKYVLVFQGTLGSETGAVAGALVQLGTTFTLTLTKSGTGTGTVTSFPAGINCGTTCSASFAPGTVVSLFAAAPGSNVAVWRGACSSAGAVPSAGVTLSSDLGCGATFQTPPTGRYPLPCPGR
jgi:hypothetical protein